ncbi:WD40 repeat-like protein [Martensiomyces pterosporus]|nr:WD40 repeat-like protein [Martensiomyces pterosporus]
MARRMEAQERQKHAGDETLPKEKPPAPATATADVAASVSAPTRTSCTLASTSTQATSLAPKATTTRAENQSASPENHHHHVRRSPQFNYDRFIPARSPDSAIDMRAFERSHRPSSPAAARQVSHIEYKVQIEEANRTYDALLRSELLNDRSTIDDIDSSRRLRSSSPPPSRPSSRRDLYRLSSSPSQLPSLVPWSSSVAGGTSSRPTTPPTSPPRTAPMFQYRSPRKTSLVQPPGVSTPAPSHARNLFGRASPVHESPIKQESRRILSPRQAPRRIAKDPVKVLDAPGIRDDYYLNLLDWSSTNKIAVALNSEVYMWDAKSSRANRVCDVGDQGGDDWVTSVRWAERGKHLAIGLNSGTVQIWDVNRGCKIRDFAGHSRRVGVLEWNGSILSSGSRDKRIYNRDTRMREGSVVSTFYAHEQEVCGLRWSPDRTQLASGGNDNLLNIWDTRPLYQFTEHTAAVKALSWSPTQSGLLASGGGTDDRCIRMWNTQTGRQISSFDTGSQVCNLSWSHDGTEIASTHGYSQNHVIIWKYPSMRPAGILNGHTRRVLYLAHSPDGQTIVTAAGDETLRFWSVAVHIHQHHSSTPAQWHTDRHHVQLLSIGWGGS